jgi:hypothetical protein
MTTDVADVIRDLQERGWTDDEIARVLNSPAALALWPPPPGIARWTTYAVRATLGEVSGLA